MTVKELIKILKKLDKDSKIVANDRLGNMGDEKKVLIAKYEEGYIIY